MILCTIHIRKINIHTIFHRFNFDLDPTQSTQLLFVSPKRKEDSALAMSKDQASSFPQKSSIYPCERSAIYVYRQPQTKNTKPETKRYYNRMFNFHLQKKHIQHCFIMSASFEAPKLSMERNFNMKIFVVSRCFNKTSGRAFQLLLVSIAFQSGSPT